MARSAKEFDCLEMKTALQERLRRRWKGLSSRQIVESIRKDMANSNDPLVIKWRNIPSKARARMRSPRQPAKRAGN